MSTYKMGFSAKIESIDTTNMTMVVEFMDPHGGDSIRGNMALGSATTVEEVKELIAKATPHEIFHRRNEHKLRLEAGLDITPILELAGSTFDYKLPSYDNEII